MTDDTETRHHELREALLNALPDNPNLLTSDVSGAIDLIVKRVDAAIAKAPVLYATHNFMGGTASGVAHLFTEDLFVRATSTSGEVEVEVIPMRRLRGVTMAAGTETRKFHARDNAWAGCTVKLEFDGTEEEVMLPGAVASSKNTAKFTEVYPRLLAGITSI
ncbi:hypothetical protein [Clavibacter nebraskensis]|uniref:hypothetical protein n=1 Tax=Clavibacter nebraskensis TaxID=31963 RepID=UPI003F87A753